jgi:hypothetical protein
MSEKARMLLASKKMMHDTLKIKGIARSLRNGLLVGNDEDGCGCIFPGT